MRGYLIIILLIHCNAFSQTESERFFQASLKAESIKDYDQAIMYIKKAIDVDTLRRDYRLQKVKLLYLVSNCNEGLKELESIVLRNNKFDDVTVTYYAELADCIGEFEKGNQILLEYVNENSSDEILATIAQRYYRQRNYDEAIYFYRKLIENNSNDIDAIIDLAKILYSFKSPQEAIKELEGSLEINRDNVNLLLYLSSCYYNSKQFDKAVEVQNKILHLDYKPEYLASRAMLYELLKEDKRAYEDYLQIVQFIKCDEKYFNKILNYEFINKNYKGVINHSINLIKCNSENESSLLDGLYVSYFFINDYKNGKFYLNKKLKLFPKIFIPYYYKILVSFNDKDYQNILKYIHLASNAEDIEINDIENLKFLTVSYYILTEDYQGLYRYIEANGNISLKNSMNFTFIQKSIDRAEIKTTFNEKTGIVNTLLIIPGKIMKMVGEKLEIR